MWTPGEVRQAGRTRERDRFRDCRAVTARVHAMEAAGLGEVFGQEEDEMLRSFGNLGLISSFPRWQRRDLLCRGGASVLGCLGSTIRI